MQLLSTCVGGAGAYDHVLYELHCVRTCCILNKAQDLNHLFDWNTKQLFVMLTAHYTTKNTVSHPVPARLHSMSSVSGTYSFLELPVCAGHPFLM